MHDLSHLPIVNGDDRRKAAQTIIGDWRKGGAHTVVHYLYYSNFILLDRDAGFRNSMAASDYILIDGIGMQLYLSVVKGIWPYNLNGTDLNPVFLRALDANNIPIALYGTTAESMAKARANISAYLPNGSIYYTQDGFSPLNWSTIREGSALLVGMGSPRQEDWTAEHLETIRKKKLLVITVGGFFDFASGVYVRAPRWVRALKLEWAWRTMLHPRRHLKKRFRDLTILYRPIWDKVTKQGKKLTIRDI